MTRCGIRTCTLPEHRVTPLPSSVDWQYQDMNGMVDIYPAPVYHDPGYDQPGPPRRSDFSVKAVATGFIMFVAIVLFCFLASLVEVGP